MKSLVRALPAAAYTFNTVPIWDPGGLNSHGRVWETFPVPVRDFTPRLYYFRETRFPKPDSEAGFRSRTPKPDSLEIGLSPNSSPNTRSYSLNQSVHYQILFGCPTLLLGRRTSPKLTSEAGLRGRTHSELGYLPIRLKIHGSIPWTNPFTIGSFSGVPHYYWDVGRPGRVSGPIPTTASLTRTGWPVGPPASYQSN